MKAALEKEIFDSVTEFELKYGCLLKSIRCVKYDDGTLEEFRFAFDEIFDAVAEANRMVAQTLSHSGRIGETLESSILDSIQYFEHKHNVIFKSIKLKKDKENKLTGITVNFEGNNIPVLDIPVRKNPVLVKKYHLQEYEQKIPDGFKIYEERLEVAGIQHRRDAATQFVNQTNQWLEFESDPLNKYDSSAIKILGCYQQNNENIKLHVGYVPAGIAKQISNFSANDCKARLLKTYIGNSGYVEILFQVLGPKGRLKDYTLLYEKTDAD